MAFIVSHILAVFGTLFVLLLSLSFTVKNGDEIGLVITNEDHNIAKRTKANIMAWFQFGPASRRPVDVSNGALGMRISNTTHGYNVERPEDHISDAIETFAKNFFPGVLPQLLPGGPQVVPKHISRFETFSTNCLGALKKSDEADMLKYGTTDFKLVSVKDEIDQECQKVHWFKPVCARLANTMKKAQPEETCKVLYSAWVYKACHIRSKNGADIVRPPEDGEMDVDHVCKSLLEQRSIAKVIKGVQEDLQPATDALAEIVPNESDSSDQEEQRDDFNNATKSSLRKSDLHSDSIMHIVSRAVTLVILVLFF